MIGILVASVFLFGSSSVSPLGEPDMARISVVDHDNRRWNSLLACALAHTADCKELLGGALQADSAINRQLAAILLEEWDLTHEEPRFARARQVWIPLPSFQELAALLPSKVEADFVVVSGVVSPTGTVEGAELLRGGRYPALNEAILKAFAAARYRPARDKGGAFISQRIEYLYRLEPR